MTGMFSAFVFNTVTQSHRFLFDDLIFCTFILWQSLFGTVFQYMTYVRSQCKSFSTSLKYANLTFFQTRTCTILALQNAMFPVKVDPGTNLHLK